LDGLVFDGLESEVRLGMFLAIPEVCLKIFMRSD
jgi:hypothetical protein